MTASPPPGTPDPDAHVQRVNDMFSRMAGRYDLQNHLFSLGIDYWWHHNLAKAVVPGPTGKVLDLAAGTLRVSLDVVRRYPGIHVIAADISEAMLEYGFKNRARSGEKERITTLVADARDLPLQDNSVDAVTMAFGIRNVIPRGDALRQIHRVLVPGGRVCILEFAPMTIPVLGAAYHWYLETILPRLAGLISDSEESFAYLARSIRDFPAPEAFVSEIGEAGFPFVQHIPFTFGIANLYIGIKA